MATHVTTRSGEPIDDYEPPYCRDCAVEVQPDTPPNSYDWQWYMVHDSVWAQTGLHPNGGCLCIPCLEARIGRLLTPGDLKDVGVNHPHAYEDTARLHNLKARKRLAPPQTGDTP